MLKSFITILIILTIPLIFISCSYVPFSSFKITDNYKRPLMNHKDRENYIMNYGFDLNWDLKESFEKGKVIPSMPYYLVELVYGEPDLTILCPKNTDICDKIFEYQTNNSFVVGSISVKDGIVIKVQGQLSKDCRF